MLRTRIIPALLLRGESLVKTHRFNKFTYVGDPCNTLRIFNELEVDELMLLDITASRDNRSPNLDLLAEIASECFMPLGYGGGVSSFDEAKSVFDIGFEKVSINTHAHSNPSLISEIASHYGSQAVIVSIDVRRGFYGRQTVHTRSGKQNTNLDPVKWAKTVEQMGAGEILLTAIDKEGTWDGFDLNLVRQVSSQVSIPVIAHGGAGTLKHIEQVVKQANASAVALGSMVVFQAKGMGVLVHVPDLGEIQKALL